MMTIRPDLLEEIQSYVDIIQIEPVMKGFSDDRKFVLTSGTRKRFLLRITESDDARVLEARREMYALMNQLTGYSSLVPKGYGCWISRDTHSCIMIHEYVQGDDGEESLLRYSPKAQYAIGYQAGLELKKIHQLPAPAGLASWYTRKKQKHERYCDVCNREQLTPEELDLEPVHRYIADTIDLMKDARQTFQHDDYHPANLIIKNGELAGIIDFNRYDWGDPVHDFYKLAYYSRTISIPFSRGQIDGYFEGYLPPDFWKKYALYNAMSIIPTIVWSSRMASREKYRDVRANAIPLILTLIRDHEGFRSAIPRWYSHSSEDGLR